MRYFLLLLMLVTPFLLFAQIKDNVSYPKDEFHIDSIISIQGTNPKLAIIRIDSLRKRCELNGWEECSRPKLEATNCNIYKNLADHTNALRCGFQTLSAESNNPEEDKEWKLKALRTIAHQYITAQNWIIAAKYIREMDAMAQNSKYEAYYGSISLLLKSLILMMQGNTDEALAMVDSTLNKLPHYENVTPEDKIQVLCNAYYYRGSINGFGARYEDSEKDYLKLVDILDEDAQTHMDEKTRNTFYLSAYSYLSNLYTYLNDSCKANKYFEMTSIYRKKFDSGDRALRNRVDYLFNSGRYEEMEAVLLPFITSDDAENGVKHEMDHYLKLYIRSLYRRGKYKEATPWVERFMDATRELFLEKGKRGMDEFMFAYEAELQKVEMMEQREEVLRMRVWTGAACTLIALLLIVSVIIFMLYKYQRRNNLFFFNQVQQSNKNNEKLSQLLVEKSMRTQLSQKDLAPAQEDTFQRVYNFLMNENQFTNPELTIEGVCAQCNISYSTLNRHINEQLSMTSFEYLTALRLDYACKLLRSTNDTIDLIAQKSGFHSTRTFQRQFKEKYNLSPTQFRKIE